MAPAPVGTYSIGFDAAGYDEMQYARIAAAHFKTEHHEYYVTPQDVKSIGMDVLRHRVAITYEAEAEEKTSETVIQKIFDELPVP